MIEKPLTANQWRVMLDDFAEEGYVTKKEYQTIMKRILKHHGY